MKLEVEVKAFSSENYEDSYTHFEGNQEEIEDIIENEFSEFLSNHNPQNQQIQPSVTEWPDKEIRSFSIEGTKNSITFIITK